MALVAAAGPVIGLALFCLYLAFRTGDWLAYSHAQADNSPFRNRTSPGPNGVVVAVRLAYQNLTRDGIVPWRSATRSAPSATARCWPWRPTGGCRGRGSWPARWRC